MDNLLEKVPKVLRGSKWLVVSDGIILLIIILIVGVFYWQFTSIQALQNDLADMNKSFSSKIIGLEAGLATTTLTSKQLSDMLAEQQNKSNDFAETIDDIAGTVGTLEKLSQTDKELLQKYSKVYFLNDNYVPMRLKSIDTEYLSDQNKEMEFHALALPYLERMLNRAQDDGVSLNIISAYRSFGTQSALKSNYLVYYGSGANAFSADQGYSEHQLGTTVDLTTDGLQPELSIGLENTPAFVWLTKNAYRYGFVLSYPKGNSYYQYEPWHWRFVGVKLAKALHSDDLNFSDMDQRDIDKYLVNIFD